MPIDLLSRWRETGGFLFERQGRGVLGIGETFRGVVPPGANHVGRAAALAQEWLEEWRSADSVATGALPFTGDAASILTIPAQVVVNRAGASDPGSADPVSSGPVSSGPVSSGPVSSDAFLADPGLAVSPPAGLEWRSDPSRREYVAAVNEAIRLIHRGVLLKVVLARAVSVDCGPGGLGGLSGLGGPSGLGGEGGFDALGINVGRVLTRLRSTNPACHLFAVPGMDGGVFVGASPETLLRRTGNAVVSLPLAGTAARSRDSGTDRAGAEALLHSAKDRSEHQPLVAAVADALAPYCASLSVDREPHLVATSTVWHLATSVRGTLRPSAPTALGLAAALHPTPAVCGSPTDAAARVIRRLEPNSRGLYAGLVGWVDGRGDGEWALSLRCATIGRQRLSLYAGAGVVADSDAEAELAETDAKLRTLIDVLEGGDVPPPPALPLPLPLPQQEPGPGPERGDGRRSSFG